MPMSIQLPHWKYAIYIIAPDAVIHVRTFMTLIFDTIFITLTFLCVCISQILTDLSVVMRDNRECQKHQNQTS